MDFLKNDSVKFALVLLGVVLLAYAYENFITAKTESFESIIDTTNNGATESVKQNINRLGDASQNDLHACFATDKELTSADLLPNNEFAGWDEAHPADKGVLEDKNFLHAGHHIGINTIGQSLRNANYNLRSEPPNPQMQVSPWSQTTIGPDMSRRPMEIGSCH